MLTAVLFAQAAPLEAVKEQEGPHTRISIDPKLLDSYVGFYRNATTGSLMIVTREDDHLLTGRAGQQPVAEYPYTDHDFFLTVTPKQNSFITDASGAVVRVVHHQWGRDETLERITAEAAQQFEDARLKRVAEERAPHTAISIEFTSAGRLCRHLSAKPSARLHGDARRRSPVGEAHGPGHFRGPSIPRA